MKAETDFSSLFAQDIPLIDVRAPVEFQAGHFPASVNLPLMIDEERRRVGICYKEKGQAAAIELGLTLVHGPIKEARVQAWLQFKKENPKAVLYCFRGGLRSQVSVQWMKEAGQTMEWIPGGYKALRRFLMNQLGEASEKGKFLILGGRTGSGKTEFLSKFSENFIDLEKHAHHRGSSFGILDEQPSQVTFENRIAVDLLKRTQSPFVLFEDESIMIGSLNVPRNLFARMQASPMVVLEKSLEERTTKIIDEYVIQRLQKQSPPELGRFMKEALARIAKKLGGLQYSKTLKQMEDAFLSERVWEPEIHECWVRDLLVHYYDPFYDRSLKKNAHRIIFRGNERQCREWIPEFKTTDFNGKTEL